MNSTHLSDSRNGQTSAVRSRLDGLVAGVKPRIPTILVPTHVALRLVVE